MTYKDKILGNMPEEWKDIVIERMCPGDFIGNFSEMKQINVTECEVNMDCTKCWNQPIEKFGIKEE